MGPPEAEITVVPNATAGLADEGVTARAAKLRLAPIDEVDTASILKSIQDDWDALAEKGWNWEAAVRSGHKFASSGSIPYNKLRGPEDLSALMRRTTESAEEWLSATKGGDVLSDATVARRIQQWSSAFDLDPQVTMGALTKAGEAARTMVAQMEAGYLVAQRSFQDATATAWRIVHDISIPGEAPDTELLQQQLTIAATALGNANAIRAAAGRAVRRNRSEFLPTPEQIAALRSVDGKMLAQLLNNAGGDIRKLGMVVRPSTWERLTDFASFLYVNNLLWGWKTHAVNTIANVAMLVGRPAERIIGSYLVGGTGAASVRAQAMRQYVYMGASLVDSFRAAKEAFLTGDSAIAAHKPELYQGLATTPTWKDGASTAAIGYNALVGAGGIAKYGLGLPTRFLGASDEMMKVITYRSVVGANAWGEAYEHAIATGLVGDAKQSFIRDYVSKKLDAAFDAQGRAIDMTAKREAQVVTFSQDLLPGTFGKGIQDLVSNVPMLRFILPFVKTPTNVMRYGIKLTPGLNLLVQGEFRDAFFGKLGDTAQARQVNMIQARGQMALGLSFLGAAGFIISQGRMSGGGPSDPVARRKLMETGWQPYSIRTVNPDGSASFNSMSARMDPFMMPFAIMADIKEALEHPEGEARADEMVSAVAMSIVKQLANKTYLQGLSQTLEALVDPGEKGSKVDRAIGTMASNMVPMASALRSMVNPMIDDTMKDARSIVDRVRATIPGLGADLPPRRDIWGDPRHVQLGFTSATDGLVDQEMQRLIMETQEGQSIAYVNPSYQGTDLRDVTTAGGRNAYDELQELSGHLPNAPSLKDLVAKAMRTKAYRDAPDGASRIKGTKLYILGSVINPYHQAAMKRLRADPEVRKALYASTEKVRAAAAAKQRDPSGAIPQRRVFDNLLQSFGLGQ